MMGLEHNLMLGFAKSWGLFYLIALALGVVVYTFWPGNKKRFEHAKTSIMNDESGPWA
jgi:cytochrome c oxidase cbb3-type subunit 4